MDKNNELSAASERNLVTKNYFDSNRTCKNINCGKNGLCVKTQTKKRVVYLCKCSENAVLQKASCPDLNKKIEASFQNVKRPVKRNNQPSKINKVKPSRNKKEKKRKEKQSIKQQKAFSSSMAKSKASINKNQNKPKKSKSKIDKFSRNKINPKIRKNSGKLMRKAD
jgi:hypothetical protein